MSNIKLLILDERRNPHWCHSRRRPPQTTRLRHLARLESHDDGLDLGETVFYVFSHELTRFLLAALGDGEHQGPVAVPEVLLGGGQDAPVQPAPRGVGP